MAEQQRYWNAMEFIGGPWDGQRLAAVLTQRGPMRPENLREGDFTMVNPAISPKLSDAIRQIDDLAAFAPGEAIAKSSKYFFAGYRLEGEGLLPRFAFDEEQVIRKQ